MKRNNIIEILAILVLVIVSMSCSTTQSVGSGFQKFPIEDEYKLGDATFCVKGLSLSNLDTVDCVFALDDKNTQNVKVYFINQMVIYSLTFDKKARDMLRYSVNAYYTDFDNHVLLKDNANTYENYGFALVDTNWGTTSKRLFNIAHTNLNLGYVFFNNSPYFSLTSWETKNEVYDDGYATSRTLKKMSYFFTKAQAAKFLEILSEENIKKVCENISNKVPETVVTGDVY